MTLTKDANNTKLSNLLEQVGRSHGVKFDGVGLEDSQQAVRRMLFLLPQYWPQFSEVEREALYAVAKENKANPLRAPRIRSLKDLNRMVRVFQDVARTVREKGLAASGETFSAYAKNLESLLDTIIALYEKGNLSKVLASEELALHQVVPQLRAHGLHYVELSRADSRLSLQCFVDPEVEYEYEPTHHISVELMKAVNAAGSYVDDIDFIPDYGDAAGAYRPGQAQ